MSANTTLLDQVALYANLISTKDDDYNTLQRAIINLQGEVKNLMTEILNLKKSCHTKGGGATFKYNTKKQRRDT